MMTGSGAARTLQACVMTASVAHRKQPKGDDGNHRKVKKGEGPLKGKEECRKEGQRESGKNQRDIGRCMAS
jgi:hypothetical protein